MTNTSVRSSREVVQVYYEPVETDQPVRLVGWAGGQVEPGATASLRVDVDQRAMRRWDVDHAVRQPLDAGGQLVVARGLSDIRARLPVPSMETDPDAEG